MIWAVRARSKLRVKQGDPTRSAHRIGRGLMEAAGEWAVAARGGRAAGASDHNVPPADARKAAESIKHNRAQGTAPLLTSRLSGRCNFTALLSPLCGSSRLAEAFRGPLRLSEALWALWGSLYLAACLDGEARSKAQPTSVNDQLIDAKITAQLVRSFGPVPSVSSTHRDADDRDRERIPQGATARSNDRASRYAVRPLTVVVLIISVPFPSGRGHWPGLTDRQTDQRPRWSTEVGRADGRNGADEELIDILDSAPRPAPPYLSIIGGTDGDDGGDDDDDDGGDEMDRIAHPLNQQRRQQAPVFVKPWRVIGGCRWQFETSPSSGPRSGSAVWTRRSGLDWNQRSVSDEGDVSIRIPEYRLLQSVKGVKTHISFIIWDSVDGLIVYVLNDDSLVLNVKSVFVVTIWPPLFPVRRVIQTCPSPPCTPLN